MQGFSDFSMLQLICMLLYNNHSSVSLYLFLYLISYLIMWNTLLFRFVDIGYVYVSNTISLWYFSHFCVSLVYYLIISLCICSFIFCKFFRILVACHKKNLIRWENCSGLLWIKTSLDVLLCKPHQFLFITKTVQLFNLSW